MTEDNNITIDKRLARRAFEKAASTYDEVAVLQNEIGDRLIERLDYVRLQPRRVLDLGAGTGLFTRGLMKRYRKADVIAVDIAQPMLQHAARRGSWLRKPGCVCGDGEVLPFADDSFDLIFSNLMLQWCTDLQATFVELRRVLAPGGLLMFTTFGPDTLMELRASWEAVDGYSHVNSFIDLHHVGDMLLHTHWADPVMDSEYITVTYPDLRGLMQDLKKIGAHNVTNRRPRGLTGKRRLAQLVDAYEPFRTDGVLPASYEVVYGHAWSPENKNAHPENPEVPLVDLERGS